jgi:hypothetical protein
MPLPRVPFAVLELQVQYNVSSSLGNGLVGSRRPRQPIRDLQTPAAPVGSRDSARTPFEDCGANNLSCNVGHTVCWCAGLSCRRQALVQYLHPLGQPLPSVPRRSTHGTSMTTRRASISGWHRCSILMLGLQQTYHSVAGLKTQVCWRHLSCPSCDGGRFRGLSRSK